VDTIGLVLQQVLQRPATITTNGVAQYIQRLPHQMHTYCTQDHTEQHKVSKSRELKKTTKISNKEPHEFKIAHAYWISPIAKHLPMRERLY
jgi:hypothetical protein